MSSRAESCVCLTYFSLSDCFPSCQAALLEDPLDPARQEFELFWVEKTGGTGQGEGAAAA